MIDHLEHRIYRNKTKIDKIWKEILDQFNIPQQINARVQSFILKEQLYPMELKVTIPKKHALEFSKISQSRMIYNYYRSVLSEYISKATDFKIVQITYNIVDPKDPQVTLYIQPKTILNRITESLSEFFI
jgi:hypothetical protein